MKQVLLLILMLLMVGSLACVSAKANESMDVTEIETVSATEEFSESTPVTELTETEGLSADKVVPGDTRMTYLARVGASIQVMDDGTAAVAADAYAYNTITNLLVVAELQQLRNGEWYTLVTYRCFTGDTLAIITEEFTVPAGYYYRVVNTTTAYAGNDSETQVLETGAWNYLVPGT